MKIKKVIKRIKKKKREIQVGDVYRNPMLMEIEIVEIFGVLKRQIMTAMITDYNSPEDGSYYGIFLKKMIKKNKLKFVGRVEYRPRLFSFLPDKRIWVEKA